MVALVSTFALKVPPWNALLLRHYPVGIGRGVSFRDIPVCNPNTDFKPSIVTIPETMRIKDAEKANAQALPAAEGSSSGNGKGKADNNPFNKP